jgi:acyl-CoA synthetase (NDP forming)
MLATATGAMGNSCGAARKRLRNLPPAAKAVGAIRSLNLHEYPSFELLRDHGIRTPKTFVASNATEARDLYERHFAKGTHKIRSDCG